MRDVIRGLEGSSDTALVPDGKELAGTRRWGFDEVQRVDQPSSPGSQREGTVPSSGDACLELVDESWQVRL